MRYSLPAVFLATALAPVSPGVAAIQLYPYNYGYGVSQTYFASSNNYVQWYSPTWTWNAQQSYWYRRCTFSSGHYFYMIYKPSFTNQYIFCYNPYTSRYCCVAPTIHHPAFAVQQQFTSTFILILNIPLATTVEKAALPENPKEKTQGTVPLKNANGQPVGTIQSLPTDLPPG